jgi:hypothetical protein
VQYSTASNSLHQTFRNQAAKLSSQKPAQPSAQHHLTLHTKTALLPNINQPHRIKVIKILFQLMTVIVGATKTFLDNEQWPCCHTQRTNSPSSSLRADPQSFFFKIPTSCSTLRRICSTNRKNLTAPRSSGAQRYPVSSCYRTCALRRTA